MKISDEQLMAYADGELAGDERAMIAEAVARDPALAEQVRAHQSLRAELANAFGGVLDEPAPARLAALLSGATDPDAAERTPAGALPGRPANAGRNAHGAREPLGSERLDAGAAAGSDGPEIQSAAPVVSMDARREQRMQERRAQEARRRWSWPEWGAIAASVVAGVMGANALMHAEGPIGAANGTLVARGELANALTHQLAADTPGAVRVGVSFRARDGGYCRTFTYQGTAGLACRVGEQWTLPMLAQTDATTPSAQGGYRQAATSVPSAVLDAVDARINGTALDAAAEKSAAANGWR